MECFRVEANMQEEKKQPEGPLVVLLTGFVSQAMGG